MEATKRKMGLSVEQLRLIFKYWHTNTYSSDWNAGYWKRFTVPGSCAGRASGAGDTAHEPMRKTRAQLGCKQRLASTGAHNVLPRKGGQRVDWRPSLALLLLSGLPMLLIAASSWRGVQAGHSRWLPGQLNG